MMELKAQCRRDTTVVHPQRRKDLNLDEHERTTEFDIIVQISLLALQWHGLLLHVLLGFITCSLSWKLVVSKKQCLSIFMDELLLSALVLSYSPKSDHAWSHRRRVIKMIAGKKWRWVFGFQDMYHTTH